MKRICRLSAELTSRTCSSSGTWTPRRGYVRPSGPASAQPISIPTLDGDASAPPPKPPTAIAGEEAWQSSASYSSTHTQQQSLRRGSSSRSIAVPTTSSPSFGDPAIAGSADRQLVKVTLRKRALDIDCPSLGFSNATFPYIWLRDVCTSSTSVDASTKQKLFKFEDVHQDVKPLECRIDEQTHELIVEWDRPLKGIAGTSKGKQSAEGRDVSKYSLEFLRAHASRESWTRRYRMDAIQGYRAWSESELKRSLLKVPKNKLDSPDIVQASLASLFRDGIAMITEVPTGERSPDNCALVEVANKFGEIMRTWYGDRTFSVRSYANSKNIAYTSLPLDLHMDLLHFKAPPRWQFLHCLHLDPQLQGGESYFVDAYKAAEILRNKNRAAYDLLCKEKIGFEYRNDGHWTYDEKPTFEVLPEDPDRLQAVNYSPPFQAPFRLHPARPTTRNTNDDTGGEAEDSTDRLHAIHTALSAYRMILEDPSLRFQTQLHPGDCVVFDNRRVLHARTGFSLPPGASQPQGGELRWLMGCYLDETSVMDRFRALGEDHAYVVD